MSSIYWAFNEEMLQKAVSQHLTGVESDTDAAMFAMPIIDFLYSETAQNSGLIKGVTKPIPTPETSTTEENS